MLHRHREEMAGLTSSTDDQLASMKHEQQLQSLQAWHHSTLFHHNYAYASHLWLQACGPCLLLWTSPP